MFALYQILINTVLIINKELFKIKGNGVTKQMDKGCL